MDMGAAGLIKQPGYKDLIILQNCPADRAFPLPAPIDAVHTACNMHEPVNPGKGRKGGRLYLFPIL
jgi:hypothetical protein